MLLGNLKNLCLVVVMYYLYTFGGWVKLDYTFNLHMMSQVRIPALNSFGKVESCLLMLSGRQNTILSN